MKSQFYNHIELYEPIVSDLFTEFSQGKIYRIMITSNMSDYDIEPMSAAQQIINELDDIYEEEVSLETILNPTFFPGNITQQDLEADNNVLIDDSLYLRQQENNDNSNIEKLIVADFIVKTSRDADIICSISTVSIELPEPNSTFKVH
jgi:hypothetical protein